jgi:hypothetical protein
MAPITSPTHVHPKDERRAGEVREQLADAAADRLGDAQRAAERAEDRLLGRMGKVLGDQQRTHHGPDCGRDHKASPGAEHHHARQDAGVGCADRGTEICQSPAATTRNLRFSKNAGSASDVS